jgi:hypothetical protein
LDQRLKHLSSPLPTSGLAWYRKLGGKDEMQNDAAQGLWRLQLSVRNLFDNLNMMVRKTRVDSRNLSAKIFEYVDRNDLDAANDLFRHALNARKSTVDPKRFIVLTYAIATVLGFFLLLVISQFA